MAILAKKTGGGGLDLGPMAPGGVHQAICVDVIDLGLVKGVFEGKPYERHKVAVVWQLATRDPQTQRRYLVGKRYTLSLSEKAALRKDLESWRSKPFTRDEELGGFDVEKIKGINCMVNVQQVVKATGTYANVIAIMPKYHGVAVIVPENYARPGAVAPVEEPDIDDDPFGASHTTAAPPVDHAPPPAITDDDIPF